MRSSTILYDLRFFHSLDRVVLRESWLDRDRAPIDSASSIGTSVTAYDRLTNALIRNKERSSRASSASSLRKYSDGSVDVLFGPVSSRKVRRQTGYLLDTGEGGRP